MGNFNSASNLISNTVGLTVQLGTLKIATDFIGKTTQQANKAYPKKSKRKTRKKKYDFMDFY